MCDMCGLCELPPYHADTGGGDKDSTATSGVGASGNQDIDGLVQGTKWAVTNLTFSFPTDASQYGYGTEKNTFGVMTAQQQTAVRAILDMYSKYTNLTFTEVTESSTVHGELRFAKSDSPSTAWGYYPSTGEWGGDSWYNTGGYGNPAKGNYDYHTFMHEIGHNLGLKHGHDTSGFGALPANHDAIDYSIMTYRTYVGGPTTGYTYETWGAPQTLMLDDVAALHYMYGANYNTNSGNSTYTWNASTGAMSINGVSQGAPGGNVVLMCMWDGGGIDTYDLSNYTESLKVDLRPGEWVTLAQTQLATLGTGQFAHGSVCNSYLVNGDTRSLIENVNGGTAADRITGNDAANTLNGNGGADTIVGGVGNDTITGGSGNDSLFGDVGDDNLDGGIGNDFMYGGTGNDSYVIDSGSNEAAVELAGEGTADVVYARIDYTLGSNIEQLILQEGYGALNGGGSNDGNVIIGNSLANRIYGYGGNDTINGGGGNDSILGGDGNDAIDGQGGDDVMIGGVGNDSYVIDSLSDCIIEYIGDGTDTVYSSINYTLSGNLEQLILQEAGGAINGSGDSGDNSVIGNSFANLVYGYGGNDTLLGLGGNDSLLGGDGADTIEGGAGNDYMFGQTGADAFKFSAGDGVDVIGDFSKADGDKLLISTGLAADLASFLAHGQTVGGNAIFTFGSQVVAISGISHTALTAADVQFFA